ncbi:efflux RND transporter permease subunit [Halorientalis salina]|uniref:efflux RND transporter permease subunit n=1 Tax=Halorientalis salina TaxID=2932266 RepID=UPI0010AC8D72|nr:MMPL family transporter [Halorientalis salina]
MDVGSSTLDRVGRWVVERAGTVVAAFLVATVVFGLGLGAVTTEAGTSQFTEATPAQQAFESVSETFEPTFGPTNESTQLIQRDRNVLAKSELVAMLRAIDRLEGEASLRVASTESVAETVARTIDPTATTTDEQLIVLENATDTEIEAAVRRAAARDPTVRTRLSEDFNRESATASATIAVVTHELPTRTDATSGASGNDPLEPIQVRAQSIVAPVDADVQVFGSGLVAAEFATVVGDSLLLVVPAALVLILLFLIVAFRDPFDLLLAVLSLALTLVWTFGFMGLAGIPFTQMLIAVPPLVLAVGIDFGIHTINRYREERVTGMAIGRALERTFEQLLVAFAIVTGTTVVGFGANLSSALAPIRDFGLVAAVSIVFTFLIFGLFLPALKVMTDRFRERRSLPQFGSEPLGREGSRLAGLLTAGVTIARRQPVAFLLIVAVVSGGASAYATGVDTSFSDEDFLPPAQTPEIYDTFPEPFRPSTYTVTRTIDFLEENFEAAAEDRVTIYVEGPLEEDFALESFQRARSDPPDTFVADNRTARTESIVTVIEGQAERSDSFAALVARNDLDGDGIPERDLGTVYDRLLTSPARDQALRYISEDRRSARVVYTTESDASQSAVTADARRVADRYRFEATATGETVVFQSVSEVIFRSAIRSLVVALVLTALFLLTVYKLLVDYATLGLVNLVPILVTVTFIAGSMRALGVPFNALTATILSITIGLGIDYSAHVVHRFADEFDPDASADVFPAIERTVRGTGGALTGSMLTTTSGIGVLVLAFTPILGQFGLITALSVFYSYLAAVVVTPSVVVVWHRLVVTE